jgi:ECF sigma factor
MADSEVARLLAEIVHGDKGAVDQLLPLVYDELRHLARGQFHRERNDYKLQPGHRIEAYMKLIGERRGDESHSHILALAATLMRQASLTILVSTEGAELALGARFSEGEMERGNCDARAVGADTGNI